MKASTVRGTPVRSIVSGNEGRMAGTPSGMSGTVPTQYEGDQSRKVNPRSGTPYTSQNGNSANAMRVASSDRQMGVVLSENGLNMSEPTSNGNGVILDGISRESDYTPMSAATVDSPVPHGAATFPIGAMRAENIAHLGKGVGVNASQAGDVLTDIGGVMSRGMLGKSTPGGAVTELIEDDELKNLGKGGAIG